MGNVRGRSTWLDVPNTRTTKTRWYGPHAPFCIPGPPCSHAPLQPHCCPPYHWGRRMSLHHSACWSVARIDPLLTPLAPPKEHHPTHTNKPAQKKKTQPNEGIIQRIQHTAQVPHSQDTGHRSQVTGHRSQVTGHRSQVTGHRSQVTGHRSQVTGHRSQVTGHRSTQNTHPYKKSQPTQKKPPSYLATRRKCLHQLSGSGAQWHT